MHNDRGSKVLLLNSDMATVKALVLLMIDSLAMGSLLNDLRRSLLNGLRRSLLKALMLSSCIF